MSDLDRKIVQAAEGIQGILALLVFGSRARGEARPDSDLDVAVLPESLDAGARRRLQADLAVALAELAPEGRVDVVLLDEAGDVLRHRALATGRLLLCRDRRAWSDFQVATFREHGDREWARRLLREAQRERLARKDFGGRSGQALESLERTGRLSR